MECRALLWGSLTSAIASLLALNGTTNRYAASADPGVPLRNFSRERRKGTILTVGSKSLVDFKNLIADLEERI
jgi:hypothetical protein